MKITSAAGYQEANQRLITILRNAATGMEPLNAKTSNERQQLESALSEYREQSSRRLDQFTDAGGSSGELAPRPATETKTGSTADRLRFRDVNSGEVIEARNSNERFSDPRLPDSMAGEYLCAAISGDDRRIARLSEEMRASGVESAMSGNIGSAGGIFIPNVISNQVIDLARSASVCQRAGARTVAMDSGTLTIARLLSDPSAQWRGEGEHVDPSSASFGSYNVITKFLACIVPMTVELASDAPNAATVVQNAIAAAMGLELDLYALRGISAGAGPTGLKNTPGINIVDFATVVGSPSRPYRPIGRGVGQILDHNYPGTVEQLAMITSPKIMEEYDSLVDSTGQPLMPTPWSKSLNKLASTSIPDNLPPDLNGNPTSEIYIGDFSQMCFFVRQGIQMELLRDGVVRNISTSSQENLLTEFKIAIRASMRVDVCIMRPNWFSYLTGVAFDG